MQTLRVISLREEAGGETFSSQVSMQTAGEDTAVAAPSSPFFLNIYLVVFLSTNSRTSVVSRQCAHFGFVCRFHRWSSASKSRSCLSDAPVFLNLVLHSLSQFPLHLHSLFVDGTTPTRQTNFPFLSALVSFALFISKLRSCPLAASPEPSARVGVFFFPLFSHTSSLCGTCRVHHLQSFFLCVYRTCICVLCVWQLKKRYCICISTAVRPSPQLLCETGLFVSPSCFWSLCSFNSC